MATLPQRTEEQKHFGSKQPVLGFTIEPDSMAYVTWLKPLNDMSEIHCSMFVSIMGGFQVELLCEACTQAQIFV
jgi:hypothetical protein